MVAFSSSDSSRRYRYPYRIFIIYICDRLLICIFNFGIALEVVVRHGDRININLLRAELLLQPVREKNSFITCRKNGREMSISSECVCESAIVCECLIISCEILIAHSQNCGCSS